MLHTKIKDYLSLSKGNNLVVVVAMAFSLHAKIWGECLTFIPRLRFWVVVFFKVEISSHTLIPLFRPGSAHSGSASRDDCDRAFPDELHVSLFPDRFPHYVCTAAWAANFNLIGSKVYAHFRCNLPPALLAEWPESFMYHCGNMGVEWTLSKSQYTKRILEKKILPLLLPEFKLTTFRSQVRCS